VTFYSLCHRENGPVETYATEERRSAISKQSSVTSRTGSRTFSSNRSTSSSSESQQH